MKSLVTGIAGFIGSHVADALVERGDMVMGIDDLSGGFLSNVPPDATCFGGSITDAIMVESLFSKYKFDYVYHLAAYAAEGLSHFIRNYNYTNNLIGSVNLINAAVRHGVKRFVFMSSIAVYGGQEPPFTEAMTPQPMDPYGIAKYAVELDLAAAHEVFGLNYTIFRTHNVYGERQNIGDPYRNVIGIFMNRIMRSQPLHIFGNGQQLRAFTYVGDVAPVVADSVLNDKAANETFNLGSDNAASIAFLANRVCLAMGINSCPIEFLPERHEAFEAWCDHTKAKLLLGAPCVTKLGDGLARMANWVRREGPRESKPFNGIEIESGLPESWRKVLA
jgi:UDP-glucose 4-epimerase